MKRVFPVFLFLLVFAWGCSRHNSTLTPDDSGRKTAYNAPVESLLGDVHLGMLQAFPGRNLTPIDDGRVKGYSTWTRVLLDTFSQQAILIPVKGVTADGKEVQAYALDVSGSGSSNLGAMRNTKLYKTLKETMDAKYPIVTVR